MQGDGKLFYGVHVVNGRLRGEAKAALRTLIERFKIPVRLTLNQDIILTDIQPAWRNEITTALRAAGCPDPSEVDSIDRTSIACPALPLCGLAIGEAERNLPDINRRLRALLVKLDMADEHLLVRMTGCPNGCARPYMAELGFVGDGPNSYQLWIGGTSALTRIARPFAEKARVHCLPLRPASGDAVAGSPGSLPPQVKVTDLERELEPLFFFFKSRRQDGETFGDFVSRVGFDMLRLYQEAYVPLPFALPPSTAAGLPQLSAVAR